MNNSTILITETYQDKNDTRKSTKYILPLSLTGLGLGFVADVILVMISVYDLSYIKEQLNKIDKKIKDNKLNKKDVEIELMNMKNKALEIKEDYENIVKKYGHIEESITIPEINEKKKIRVK